MKHPLICLLGLLTITLRPAAAEPLPDPYIGDWQGDKIAAQVVALGGGSYRAKLLPEFDKRVPALAVVEGTVADGKLVFTGADAVIQNDTFTGKLANPFTMKRVTRLSPALGAKPPAGAIVLLGADTTDLQTEWQRQGGQPCGWTLLPGGVMQCAPGKGSIITKRQFGNHKVHVEFRTPFEPDKRGQGRGNSGVYLQGRYELQVLDSYGLEGLDNECGGIYKIAKPRVNMCAPPTQWQTYDITFTAAALDGDNVAKPARISVHHNGVLIHENQELPGTTTAAPVGKVGVTGGLYLQDHGNKVEYRNIWVEELAR